MQLYESVAIKDAWWNVCCRECREPITADNPYRDVKITWAEILAIGLHLWGPPDGFFVRDFLISMEFRGGQIVVTFCSQGSRRGEVEISISSNDENAHTELAAFLAEIRRKIEGQIDWDYLEDSGPTLNYEDEEWEDFENGR